MTQPFVPDLDAALVRYLVTDVDRALAFYTQNLGFRLVKRAGPVTTIARGALHVLLSSPDSSGAKPMPDGTRQAPGGWNRMVLYNTVESGPGGRQIQVEDPDGNPIELHEPPKP